MKKRHILILLFVLSTFSSQAQILNGNFEEWDVEDTVEYSTGPEIIYKPRYWSKLAYPEFYTLLNYAEHPKKAGKSLSLYSYAFGGNLSYSATSMFIYGQITDSVYLRTYKKWVYRPHNFHKAGMPYTGRPQYFGGIYINWQADKIDSALAQVILRKYNPTLKKSDTIGIGKCYLVKTTNKPAIESDFIPFSVKIDYQSSDNPDTISIILASNKNLPENLINHPKPSIFPSYNIIAEYAQLLIDSLYLTDKVMSLSHAESHGIKVWYHKESATTGHLYISAEKEQQVEAKAYSSDGKQSFYIPQSIYLKTGINRIPIQRNSPSEILFLQLLDQGDKLPIGSMKIY